MSIDGAIPGDRNVTKKEVGKILKHLRRTHNRNSTYVEFESKSDTG
jgi:hypothetical protein